MNSRPAFRQAVPIMLRYGKIFFKHLLSWPLFAAVVVPGLAARCIRLFCRPGPPDLPATGPCGGVTVLIPERGAPEVLGRCLESLEAALLRVDEEKEVLVVVNGSPAEQYGRLAEKHKQVRWIFYASPLSFSEAVRLGLREARFPWIYLLNSDMFLEPAALREVMAWRAPHVFAVASQIFLADPSRRREETGWTGFRIESGVITIFDMEPVDSARTRGNLYAGGGSSLFQKSVLSEIMGRGDPYAPLYWEDVEWGAEAWKRGFEVLFCPSSRVRHVHRATVSRFYPPEEIDRIFRRNGYHFQLRNLVYLGDARALRRHILSLDRGSFLSLARPSNLLRVAARRFRSAFYPFDDRCLESAWGRYYSLPREAMRGKPTVLLVSPYALFPPAHGGAIRLYNLLRRLAGAFHIVLLSDEAEGYGTGCADYFDILSSVHLVRGRRDSEPGGPGERVRRIRSHSHRRLQDELRRLIAAYRPALVQIEFVELCGLVCFKSPGTPWVLTLHDVLLPEPGEPWSREDAYEMSRIRKFDMILVCSEEDRKCLPHGDVAVVHNGASIADEEYIASPCAPVILFAGPLRYRPNLDGIRRFLERVYPRLRRRVPPAELWLLAGAGGLEIADGMSCFRQPGVTLFDRVEQTRPFLRCCALTINPITGSRGSSLKLIESLAANRVCLSTIDGTRGYSAADFSSLISTERVEDFLEPLVVLLTDHRLRRSIEQTPREWLAPYSWEDTARAQERIYRDLIEASR